MYLQLLAEDYGSGLLTVLRMRDSNARSSWLESKMSERPDWLDYSALVIECVDGGPDDGIKAIVGT